jgi:CspA family cold shock protein
MNTGTVKFFNEDKGFGFIIEDETQNEIFVHVSGLEDDVDKNDKVSYETTEGRKGLNAINVRRI